MKLIIKFIKLAEKEGIKSALQSTKDFVIDKIQYILDTLNLILLRIRSGSWEIVREVNGNRMRLDIHPFSENKIERELAINIPKEKGATYLLTKMLSELKHAGFSEIYVFDIGANIGYYTLLESNILEESSSIYAIEPDPTNVNRLEHNIELNNYSNIDIIHAAVGPDRTQMELSRSRASNRHKMAEIFDNEKDIIDSLTVEVYTIDDIIIDKKINDDDLVIIRMDLNGYERNAFHGMTTFLQSNKSAYVFVEIHPKSKPDRVEDIIDYLQEGGFDLEYVSYDGGSTFQKSNNFDDARDIGPRSGQLVASRIEYNDN